MTTCFATETCRKQNACLPVCLNIGALVTGGERGRDVFLMQML